MDPIRIATHGFPGALSELIARAAMGLPGLTGKDDAEFLRTMTEIVSVVFWSKFIDDLPDTQQKEAAAIFHSKNVDALTAWMERHCNIFEDEPSMQRANRVLADLEARLPGIVLEEYKRFQEAMAAA